LNVTTPVAQTVINLSNSGTTAEQVTAFTFSGTSASLFHVTTPVPATIPAGGTLAVTVTMTTSGGTLPAMATCTNNCDSGSDLLEGTTLTATLGSGSAQASVYGLVLWQMTWEPTLGQIITTLGYDLNVVKAQNDWNPNTINGVQNPTTLPGVEANTDEVAAPSFVKAAGAASVTMNVVARFSPVGILPYGWYPSTAAAPASSTTKITGAVTVGTMSMVTNGQTSNNARMVYPPLAAGSATTFDPGTTPFGIWIYSDQATNTWAEGGNAENGDYDYSNDSFNVPKNTPPVHRIKVYPLKNATGTAIPQSYLIAVEEAANGDYQDYVFVLGNVTVAP
jgi:hypothetical protein